MLSCAAIFNNKESRAPDSHHKAALTISLSRHFDLDLHLLLSITYIVLQLYFYYNYIMFYWIYKFTRCHGVESRTLIDS